MDTLYPVIVMKRQPTGRQRFVKKGAPSHVLLAMGASQQAVRGALRISFSAENTKEEVLLLAESLRGFAAEVYR